MIYVDRNSARVPESLQSERVMEARARINKLYSESSEAHLKQLRITHDPSIWIRVKPDLLELFKGKCAYCESMLEPTQAGDIEHFRPKQGAQGFDNQRDHLYYGWLAYEWDNLLITCMVCNSRRTIDGKLVGKAQLFPVEGERARVLASVQECRQIEKPLLLDPCFDNPSDHLLFEESGEVKARTHRGASTIEVLGLNIRKALVESRKNAWREADGVFSVFLKVLIGKGTEEEIAAAGERVGRQLDPRIPYLAPRFAAYEKFQADAKALGVVASALAMPVSPGAAAPVQQPPSVKPIANVQAAPAIVRAESIRPPEKIADKKPLPPFAYQRIRHIVIRNFNAIESLELTIPPGPSGEDGIPGALVMLGENATGKSSVLEAVALALLGTKQIEHLKLDGRQFLRRETLAEPGVQPEHAAEIILTLEDEKTRIRLGIDLDGKFSGNDERAVVLLGYGPRRFFSKSTQYDHAPAERIRSMFDPLVTLANPQQWLLECSEDHFAFAVRALRTLLLLPDEAIVERRPAESKRKTHVVFELEGGVESLDSLSEGYKTIVAMGVDIMREMLEYWTDLESAHGIVVIDELDTHLHPRWKMRIAQRLRHALREVQFLASTHDPLCLRGYHDKEVKVLRRDANSRVEAVVDLPNVRGLSVQQLLTSEFFGLWSAEDPELEESVARYVTLASKRNRNASEDQELERQRVATDEKIQLGTTPQDQVMQQALNDYVVQRRVAPQAEKAQIERATVDKLLARMTELDANVGVAEFVAQRDNTP
jgi:uncharacterized protein (TIGR02646 family)